MTTQEQVADRAREALTRDVAALKDKASAAVPAIPIAVTNGLGALAFGVLGATLAGSSVVRRTIAGAACGIAAGWAMNQVHTAWSAIEGRLRRGEQKQTGSHDPPATVRAVEAITGPLPDDERPVAGSMAHFAMAAITGATYAALPLVRKPWWSGLAYGAAVWAVADEIAVPAFRLSAAPWTFPARVHARALLAHLVYGAVLDASLRRLA